MTLDNVKPYDLLAVLLELAVLTLGVVAVAARAHSSHLPAFTVQPASSGPMA